MDRLGRAPAGKLGSLAYTMATAMTMTAIFTRAVQHHGDKEEGGDGAESVVFYLWIGATCLWGFGKGVVYGPVLALVSLELRFCCG